MYKNALKGDLIRVVQELDGIVESTDTIVKLKTKIENSSTFESDPDFVKTLIQNCIDESIAKRRGLAVEAKEKEKSFRTVDVQNSTEEKIDAFNQKDQPVEKDVLMPVKHNVFLWNLPDVEESLSVPFFFLYVSDSPLVSMEIPLRTAYGQAGRCDMQPKPSSLRVQAHQSKSRTET
ncbi:hypothetical protein TNCV_2365941 [Trichonephila clavipes]|nr:hypothetical protein TNCV_2365941 [Trichonephila clavipes]